LDLPKVVPATDFAAATEPSDNELSRTKERPRVQILKKSGKPAPVEPQESSRRVPVPAGPQEVLRRVPVEPQEVLRRVPVEPQELLRKVPEDRIQVSSTAAPRRLVIPTGLRARRPQSPSIIDSIPLEPTVLPRAPPSRTSPVPRILAAVPRAPTPVPRAPVPQAPISVPRTPVPRTVSRAPASTAPFQTLFQARTSVPQLRQPGFAPIAVPRAPVAVPRAPVAVPRTPVEVPRRQQAFATKAPTTTQDPFTIFSFDRAQQRIPQQPQPVFAQPQRPRNNLNKPQQALPRKFEVIKPTTKNPKNLRGRVPILDRYTIHNDDGSFTWGYQSADGSFKEETIGNDCVTRGR
jgi:hypothetical protein